MLLVPLGECLIAIAIIALFVSKLLRSIVREADLRFFEVAMTLVVTVTGGTGLFLTVLDVLKD